MGTRSILSSPRKRRESGDPVGHDVRSPDEEHCVQAGPRLIGKAAWPSGSSHSARMPGGVHPSAHAGEGAKQRREGGPPVIQVVEIVKPDEEGSPMSATKVVFVLVHGGWHNHSAW